VNGGRAWAQRRMVCVVVSSLVIVAVEDSSDTKIEAHTIDKKTNKSGDGLEHRVIVPVSLTVCTNSS